MVAVARGGWEGDGVIIFGWGRGKTKDHGEALPMTCPQCHNETFYHYFSVTRWLTLFFIPVIPYSTKHFLVCPVCTRAMPLDAAGRERAKQMVELTSSFRSGQLAQEPYLARMREMGGGAQPSIGPATTDAPGRMPPPPARPDGFSPS